MLAVSKCPDYVINKGHYFGTNLFDRGARLERRGEAGPHRVPEDAMKRARRTNFGEPPPPPAEYDADYIVVGSGAGGGTVAARLAEAGFTVLLLEAGGDPRTMIGSTPKRLASTPCPTTTTCPRSMRWRPRTTRCGGISSSATTPIRRSRRAIRNTARKSTARPLDGVLYPRAGALGGCTAHSAMIFLYPHNADWNQIADLTGDPSWRAEKMRSYFERIERCEHRPDERALSRLGRNPSRHGWEGWLQTERPLPSAAILNRDLRTTFLESVRAVLKSPEFALTDDDRRARLDSELDPNDWRIVANPAIGLRYTPLTTRNHQRVGTRERVLDVARRPPRSAEDPAARARHAGAVRCVESRDRRGVSERRARCTAPTRVPATAPGAVRAGVCGARGDSRGRRVQYAAAPHALRHRATRRSREARHRRAGRSARASGRTCRTATRWRSSTG